MAFALGGIPMSARSSRQSTADSVRSVAGSTHSVMSTASTNTANLADELTRFRPVEPDALASLLASSSTEDLGHTSAGSSSSSGGSSGRTSTNSQSSTTSSKTSVSDAGSEGSAAEKVLIIDIRSSTSYSTARIRSSINVCAPSTLLKRPGITVDHVEEEMLGSEHDRRRFKRWREGPRRVRQKASDLALSGASSLSRSNSRSKSGHGSPGRAFPRSHSSSSGGSLSAASSLASSTPSSPAASFGNSAPPTSSAASVDDTTTLLPASANGITKIIVLDTDTARVADAGKPAVGGGASCLVGMLRKFEAAGFAGELGWLVGGFNRFAGCAGAKEAGLIDRAPLVEPETDISGIGNAAEQPAQNQPALRGSAGGLRLNILPNDLASRRSSVPHPGKLDLSGFRHGGNDRAASDAGAASSAPSTGQSMLGPQGAKRHFLVQPRALPLSAFNVSTTTSKSSASHMGPSGNLGRAFTKDSISACANPFFDNVRQNRELAHGITERIPLELPSMSATQQSALPRFLQNLTRKTESERAEELAQGFFSIEKSEQKRLMGTMQQHVAESGTDPRTGGSVAVSNGDVTVAAGDGPSPNGTTSKPDQLSSVLAGIDGTAADKRSLSAPDEKLPTSPFPFSIAAALERGAENRYNNIWTYEHSRVRLQHLRSLVDPNSNYINASFVQPAREFGCSRTYIATQAPLPSTFEHFWMMCWEQNVRVIVMVTREHEAGRIQAHRYWDESCYGRDVRLRVVREQCYDSTGRELSGSAEEANKLASNAYDEAGGGLFPVLPSSSSSSPSRKPVLIRRTLALSNAAEPQEPERTLTQLQYVAWPDYTVPESPESLLRLLDIADDAQFQAEQELRSQGAKRAHTLGAGPADHFSNPFAHSMGGAISKAAVQRPVGPMVVHCSAGVGRTGTFMAVDSALDVIRRQRAERKGESLKGVWHNGKAAEDELAQSRPPLMPVSPQDSRMSNTDPSPSLTPSTHTQAHQLPPVTPPRPALKREHSMDIDDDSAVGKAGGSNPFALDDLGYRPRSRTRSIEPGSGSEGENETAVFPDPLPTAVLSPKFGRDGAVSTHSTSKWAAPSPLPTPLRHLDSMCLSVASPMPLDDGQGRAGEVSPLLTGSTPQAPSPLDAITGSSWTATHQGPAQQSALQSAGSGAGSGNGDPTSPLATVGEKTEQGEEPDIVRRIVEVMREQRMSSVQTTRQYVFVYTAVLAGVLRELRAEGIR